MEHQHAKRRTGTAGARVKTPREEIGAKTATTTHKRSTHAGNKWTTPKEGTRLNKNKSFKDEIKQIIL
jgi:hypothetical protein